MASAAAKKSVADINDSKKRVEDGVKKEKALSVDAIKDLSEGLRDIDKVVVDAIGMRKDDILDDEKLRNLVYEYFEANRQTLEYLNELENCLMVLENSHFHLVMAIRKYEHGKTAACLEKLEKFKANGDPFNEKFFPMHEKLRLKQEALLKKAQQLHDEVHQQTKNTTWTDIFTIVAASATAIAGICVVVGSVFPPAAPIAVPVGVGAILIGAGAGIAAAVGKAEKEKLKTTEKITKIILAATTCVKTELDSIKIIVDILIKQIESLSGAADEARDEDAQDIVMEDVKKKAKIFQENINNLTVHTRRCREAVFNGRDKVLDFIKELA